MASKVNSDEQISVPEAPPLPGLVFRRFRGESDYPRMADVFTRHMEANGMEIVMNAEIVARLYSNLKNSDPFKDVLMVEVDGELAAYSRAFWLDEDNNDGQGLARIYTNIIYLVPEWRERGLERAMLLYKEKRLREMAEPHDFAGPRFLQSFGYDRHPTMRQALEQEGYEPVRYEFDMVRPDLENIPDLPMPEGLETRPVQPEHLRAIWGAEVEAFRDHWGFSEPDEEDYRRWLDFPLFQPHLWQVAWEGDQVAGMIRNYISEEENERYGRKRGYTEWISVRRPWRRRGLARALLVRSFRMHKDLGMTHAALSVDAQNPLGALQLYESMGFQTVARSDVYRKPLDKDANTPS